MVVLSPSVFAFYSYLYRLWVEHLVNLGHMIWEVHGGGGGGGIVSDNSSPSVFALYRVCIDSGLSHMGGAG